MAKVKVVAIEDGGYYSSTLTTMCGSTVNVTLSDGKQTVRCDGILIWDDEGCDRDTFEEWISYAEAGEEGYTLE